MATGFVKKDRKVHSVCLLHCCQKELLLCILASAFKQQEHSQERWQVQHLDLGLSDPACLCLVAAQTHPFCAKGFIEDRKATYRRRNSNEHCQHAVKLLRVFKADAAAGFIP